MFGADAEFDERLKGFQPKAPQLVNPPSMAYQPSQGEPNLAGDATQKRALPTTRAKIPKTTVDFGPFFQVNYRLFSSGLGAKLGPSAGWLYMALCSYANDNLSMTFSVSNKALARDTGMSPRTIGEAKKILVNHGLIECTMEPGRRVRFTMKKPDLERMTPAARPRAKHKPRGKAVKKDPFGWGDMAQILRGTHADFARPYR